MPKITRIFIRSLKIVEETTSTFETIRKKMMAKEAGYSRSVNINKKSIKFAHYCPLSSKIVIRQLNVDCFVFVSKSKISTIFYQPLFVTKKKQIPIYTYYFCISHQILHISGCQ